MEVVFHSWSLNGRPHNDHVSIKDETRDLGGAARLDYRHETHS